MNLTNRRPRPVLFWSGAILVVIGIWLGFMVQPEAAPMWVKKFWGISATTILGASPAQSADGAVAGQIWRGREVFPRTTSTKSRLEFDKTPSRQEAAWADARVDGRTVYRVFWLVVGFIGFLMMIFGLGTTPDRDHLKGDVPSGGGATQPSGSGSTPSASPSPEGYAPYNPFSDVPTAFAPVQAPAQPGPMERAESESAKREVVAPNGESMSEAATAAEDDPAELFMRWTDRGQHGQQSSHELTIGGAKLNSASSLQVFFDLRQGTLISAKPTVSFERDDK